MYVLRQNRDRIDNGSDEEPRLRYDIPDRVQVTIAQEQNTRPERDPEYHEDVLQQIHQKQTYRRRARKTARQRQIRDDDHDEGSESDQGIGRRGEDDNPRREAGFGK